MNVKIYKTINASKLCWIEISHDEAMRLISSLALQVITGPNKDRLESTCKGDVDELTIVVKGEKIE